MRCAFAISFRFSQWVLRFGKRARQLLMLFFWTLKDLRFYAILFFSPYHQNHHKLSICRYPVPNKLNFPELSALKHTLMATSSWNALQGVIWFVIVTSNRKIRILVSSLSVLRQGTDVISTCNNACELLSPIISTISIKIRTHLVVWGII